MNSDQIRLRETTEKFFELLFGVGEFRLCVSDDGFWIGASVDDDPRDESTRNSSPLAEAFIDFLEAARDAGLDKEGTFERYAEERERRREIGKTIDPAIAEVNYCHSIDIDPYDMIPLHAWRAECGSQSERTWFARNPGGKWVVEEDLPDETSKALSERQDRWCANGCIDIICERLGDVPGALSFEPCAKGVRANFQRNDVITAIEFSLDDPQAHSAVNEQLTKFLEQMEEQEEQTEQHIFVSEDLRFNEQGKWIYGRFDEQAIWKEMAEDTHLVAGMFTMKRGWVEWLDGEPVTTIMGLIEEGFKPPLREELGAGDWHETCSMVFATPVTKDLYTFATHSEDGRKALYQLMKEHDEHIRNKPDDIPIVALKTSFGKPEFKVVDWVSRNATECGENV